MTFHDLPLGENVRISAILAVLGARNLRPYLVDGGDDVVDFLLSTTDDDFNGHMREIGGESIRIRDDKFMQSLQNKIFPLCGNSYSYINKITLVGILDSRELDEMVLSGITCAEIMNDEGEVININLD
jgi:hypothetical protein